MTTQTAVTVYADPQAILALAGQVADRHASARTFEDHTGRRAANTRSRYAVDLAVFARFLQQAGAPVGDLLNDVTAWRGVSWGLVDAFTLWQLSEGYAIGSVNVRLATVKTFASLAEKAGVIPSEQGRLISTCKGYSRKEGRNVDETREVTRVGAKKAEGIIASRRQVAQLKAQPATTPQGRRDALMMCLMLDHGLRVGEVAILEVAHFDLAAGTLAFYRPKVDKEQTHRLTADTLKAARAYFEAGDAPAIGRVLRGSRKDGRLESAGMSERAITARVAELGRRVGIAGLSAHDLRHTWATWAARSGTPIDRLQDAGGWASPAMPLHYVAAAKIANEGVKLE